MNIQTLETKYLNAKIAYYNGIPIITDGEFDALETRLEELGSKVIEQVGAKQTDFNFPHPTPMLSLEKIHTHSSIDKLTTDYNKIDFSKWYNSTLQDLHKQIGKVPVKTLTYSPKFDGNSINIIYENCNEPKNF